MISHLQLQKQKDKISEEILSKGNIPTSYEIESKAQEFFEVKTLGLPYYRPLKQQQWGYSNPVRYNQMFSQLETDLAIAYQANLKNNQSAIELEENYLIERNRLDARIQALRVRLAQMNQASNQSKQHPCYSQTFKDFFEIDFNGDDERNIPATTAFVDLEQRHVTIDTLSTSTSKCNISDSQLTFNAGGENVTERGDLQSLVKDTLNESYSCTFTQSTDGKAAGSLIVDLSGPTVANQVRLELASKKEVTGYLVLVKSDGTQDVLYNTSGRFNLNWSFDLSEIVQLQFTLTLPSADGIMEDGSYLYHFLFRRLTLSNEEYETSATVVSTPFELKQIPSRLTIQAKESIFNDTSVEYYLGLDNGVDKINWKNFKNGVTSGFDVTDNHLKMINVDEEKKPVVFNEDRHIYLAYELPADVLPESIKITPFYQKWKIESYSLEDDYVYTKTPETEEVENDEGEMEEVTVIKEELAFDLFNLNFDDALLHLTEEPTVTHLDCGEYVVPLKTNTIYTFTQYVDLEEEKHVDNKFIQSDNEGLQYRLFVNGAESRPVVNKINLKLKKGRNKVQVVLFAPRESSKASLKITHNLNFKEVSTHVYGELPLTEVDYHTLCNLPKWQQKANEFTSYTLKGRQLLVRHHPSFFTKEGQEFASTAYQISYQTLKASAKSLMTPSLNGYKCYLRFMAILKSADSHYSPYLHHYQILSS